MTLNYKLTLFAALSSIAILPPFWFSTNNFNRMLNHYSPFMKGLDLYWVVAATSIVVCYSISASVLAVLVLSAIPSGRKLLSVTAGESILLVFGAQLAVLLSCFCWMYEFAQFISLP